MKSKFEFNGWYHFVLFCSTLSFTEPRSVLLLRITQNSLSFIYWLVRCHAWRAFFLPFENLSLTCPRKVWRAFGILDTTKYKIFLPSKNTLNSTFTVCYNRLLLIVEKYAKCRKVFLKYICLQILIFVLMYVRFSLWTRSYCKTSITNLARSIRYAQHWIL